MGYEERAKAAAANRLRQVVVMDPATGVHLVDEPGRRVAFDGNVLMWRREDEAGGTDCMYVTKRGDLVVTTPLEAETGLVVPDKRIEVVPA